MVNYKNKYLKYKLKYEKMLNGGMNKKKIIRKFLIEMN